MKPPVVPGLLSGRVGRRFVGLLFALALLAGLRAAEVAPRFSDRREDIDRVVALLDRRLALMPEVAAWKWRQGQPVADPARERTVLDTTAAAAESLQLDPDAVRACAAVQIRLARGVQDDRFAHWRRQPESTPEARDLAAELRPALDALAEEFLVALYLASDALAGSSPAQLRDPLGILRRHPGVGADEIGELAAALARIRLVATPSLATIGRVGVLRLATTGDYAPFSGEHADRLAGCDIDLVRELADRWGVRVKFIRTTWPGLLQDLHRRRFDLAASGISITRERAEQALFSVPYHTDGKTPIARREDASRFATLAQIDHPGVRVIVNPGGTNERFAREHLRQATLLVHPDNRTIFAEIVARRADVMITDGIEVLLQLQRHPELAGTRAEPFTRADKAFLFPSDSTLVTPVNEWLAPRVASGEVAARLRRAVGEVP